MISLERSGKTFWGSWEVLESFLSKRVGNLSNSLALAGSFIVDRWVSLSSVKWLLCYFIGHQKDHDSKQCSECRLWKFVCRMANVVVDRWLLIV